MNGRQSNYLEVIERLVPPTRIERATRGLGKGYEILDFHPRYYIASGRKNAAQHINSDTRKQPRAIHPVDREPAFRFVGRPGSIILFSGAHLHSTVPNTSGRTRYSIDFRTVNYTDVKTQVGAPNIDSHSPTSALRDFMGGMDFARIPDELIKPYEQEGASRSGERVFRPD